jgi:NAD(P)H-dependent FMN reductase
MATIVGISGSLRRNSYNTALLRAAAQLMPDDTRLQIETIHGIPLCDGDLEATGGIPQPVTELKEAIAAARRAAPRNAGIQQFDSRRV